MRRARQRSGEERASSRSSRASACSSAVCASSGPRQRGSRRRCATAAAAPALDSRSSSYSASWRVRSKAGAWQSEHAAPPAVSRARPGGQQRARKTQHAAHLLVALVLLHPAAAQQHPQRHPQLGRQHPPGTRQGGPSGRSPPPPRGPGSRWRLPRPGTAAAAGAKAAGRGRTRHGAPPGAAHAAAAAARLLRRQQLRPAAPPPPPAAPPPRLCAQRAAACRRLRCGRLACRSRRPLAARSGFCRVHRGGRRFWQVSLHLGAHHARTHNSARLSPRVSAPLDALLGALQNLLTVGQRGHLQALHTRKGRRWCVCDGLQERRRRRLPPPAAAAPRSAPLGCGRRIPAPACRAGSAWGPRSAREGR